jgi:hypothetical protein
MTRSTLLIALLFLSSLFLNIYAEKIVVAQTYVPISGKGSLSHTNVVVADIQSNGHVDSQNGITLIFSGENGHTLDYPTFKPDGSQILFSYSSQNTGGEVGPTMIYKSNLKFANATRLTSNDPTNITETNAVYNSDGSRIAYNAAMASSWYGANVTNSNRLALSKSDGSKFEWLFIQNMPFNYQFDQWCQVFDPISGDLYFYSDFCSEVNICLYHYSFSQNKATEIINKVSNSCPRPFIVNNSTYILVPVTNQDKTTFGIIDNKNNWTPLFGVDLVVAEDVYDADQFFDCQPYENGKLLLCVTELSRSVVLIEWDGTGIVSSALVGDFNIGVWPDTGINTIYNSPSIL